MYVFMYESVYDRDDIECIVLNTFNAEVLRQDIEKTADFFNGKLYGFSIDEFIKLTNDDWTKVGVFTVSDEYGYALRSIYGRILEFGLAFEVG